MYCRSGFSDDGSVITLAEDSDTTPRQILYHSCTLSFAPPWPNQQLATLRVLEAPYCHSSPLSSAKAQIVLDFNRKTLPYLDRITWYRPYIRSSCAYPRTSRSIAQATELALSCNQIMYIEPKA